VTAAALADACAILAFFADDGATMTAAGVAAMEGDVAVSPITVWELTRKAALGKLPPLPEVEGSFVRWLAAQGFRVQSLTWADAERANALPPLHKDPMDRMLIAQALNTGMSVITDDALYPGYGVRTIW
jgi:PIN domain nuclease of toxin-antitoxin system